MIAHLYISSSSPQAAKELVGQTLVCVPTSVGAPAEGRSRNQFCCLLPCAAGNPACSRLSRRLSERSSDPELGHFREVFGGRMLQLGHFRKVSQGEHCSPRRLKAGGSQDWLPHK